MERYVRWRGETEPEETGGEERSSRRSKTKLATTAEMAFGILLSSPRLPLPSPTATAASYLVSAGYGRRHRALERSCRCGRPPETALSGSSGGRGSYDGEEAAPRTHGVGGSSASSSDLQMGEARKLRYRSCRATRACGSLVTVLLVW